MGANTGETNVPITLEGLPTFRFAIYWLPRHVYRTAGHVRGVKHQGITSRADQSDIQENIGQILEILTDGLCRKFSIAIASLPDIVFVYHYRRVAYGIHFEPQISAFSN